MPRASDKFLKPIRADVMLVRLEEPGGKPIDVDLRVGYSLNTELKREKKTND